MLGRQVLPCLPVAPSNGRAIQWGQMLCAPAGCCCAANAHPGAAAAAPVTPPLLNACWNSTAAASRSYPGCSCTPLPFSTTRLLPLQATQCSVPHPAHTTQQSHTNRGATHDRQDRQAASHAGFLSFAPEAHLELLQGEAAASTLLAVVLHGLQAGGTKGRYRYRERGEQRWRTGKGAYRAASAAQRGAERRLIGSSSCVKHVWCWVPAAAAAAAAAAASTAAAAADPHLASHHGAQQAGDGARGHGRSLVSASCRQKGRQTQETEQQ